MGPNERSELIDTTLSGRYRMVRRIGIGGTGVVFEAVMPNARRVAIKTLRPCFVNHPDLGRRLRREAEVSRRVHHPGIVPIHDEGTLEDGSPFLVMPLLEGESLARLLLRTTELPIDETCVLAMRVAAILHAAHCMGYVHRDVKPEHVLLNCSDSGDLVVHLLDFGVCSSADAPEDERQRENGKVFGTPSYVSPEQASGEPDVRSYSLFRAGVKLIPESLRNPVKKQLFFREIKERPQWNQETLEWAVDILEADTRQFLEYYGKPKDFWHLGR